MQSPGYCVLISVVRAERFREGMLQADRAAVGPEAHNEGALAYQAGSICPYAPGTGGGLVACRWWWRLTRMAFAQKAR